MSQAIAISNMQRNLSAVLAALAEETELKKCPTAKGLYSFLAKTLVLHLICTESGPTQLTNVNPLEGRCLLNRGATDHKTHGSDRVTVFESRFGSVSHQQRKKTKKDKCDLAFNCFFCFYFQHSTVNNRLYKIKCINKIKCTKKHSRPGFKKTLAGNSKFNSE